MREIKFRAWDGEIMGEIMYMKFPLNDSFPVMQYTGLPDKTLKGIYEEDIIERGESKGTIKWEQGRFYIDWFHNPENWSDTIYVHAGDSVIIGNIYQSPNILHQPTG